MPILVFSSSCGLGRIPTEERKHDNTHTRNRPFGTGLYDWFCRTEAKGKEAIKIKGQRFAVSQIEQRICKILSNLQQENEASSFFQLFEKILSIASFANKALRRHRL